MKQTILICLIVQKSKCLILQKAIVVSLFHCSRFVPGDPVHLQFPEGVVWPRLGGRGPVLAGAQGPVCVGQVDVQL